MNQTSNEALRLLLERATKTLPKVSWRRMFGCDAAFVNGSIFGLIWKTGRIGVKLPDTTSFNELMNTFGSAPWTAGKMKMSHWVLVPETFHSNSASLKKWATKAHGLCSKLVKAKPAKSKVS